MSQLKPFKKALIGSTALIGTGCLVPTVAIAASCPMEITGNTLAGQICEFDSTPSVTVATGGEVGSISMINYLPANAQITNNGTIANDSGLGVTGLAIAGSTLSNGIINNGTIHTYDNAIYISNGSTIGPILNSGQIVSDIGQAFGMFNTTTINGGILNSGTIISAGNNGGFVIGINSDVSGSFNNTGTIRGGNGGGDGFILLIGSHIAGDFTNSGAITGGRDGFLMFVTSTISGGITNSGTITGDTGNGMRITNGSTVTGDITNTATGTISGDNAGIAVLSTTNVAGALVNEGTIRGDNYGIYVGSTASIAGGISNSGTIQGGINAIFIEANSTVSNIDLFAGSRVIGSIDAPNTNVAIRGDFTSEGTMNVNTLDISPNAVFTMANIITAANLTNSGTLSVGTTTQTLIGDYAQFMNGLFRLGVQNTATYGRLSAVGVVDLSFGGNAIDVDVVGGANVVAGNAFTNIISGGALLGPGVAFTVTDNSRLLNFTAAVNGAGTGVDLLAVAASSVSQSNAAAGNLGGTGAAQALDNIIALNPAGDWQNVIGALNTLSSDQEVAAAVNQTSPVLMGATNTALIETMSSASRVVQARQDSNSGLASGADIQTHRHVWLKTFGSWGDQSTHDGVAGYDAKTYGLIAGADKMISDNTRLGVGASYFNSNMESQDNHQEVDVNSYLGMVYGSYRLDDRTDINAQMEAGYNSSDSTRRIDFGGLNRVATGDYGGWDFHAGTGVGRLLNAGNDTTIAPQLRVDYFVVSNESYNESGAGVLNLQVGSQTQDQLIPAVEVKANHRLNSQLSLAVNAGLGYDLLNDHNSVAASFAGGGGTFVTRGLAPSPWVARSGAGLTWQQSDTVDLTVRYDRKDRGFEYDDQTLSLKARLVF